MATADLITLSEGEYKVQWQTINEQIDVLHSTYLNALKNKNTDLIKKNYSELGKALEWRESLKAFPYIKPYYNGSTHYFRTISVSDLIVFHVLLAFEQNQHGPAELKRFVGMEKEIKNSN